MLLFQEPAQYIEPAYFFTSVYNQRVTGRVTPTQQNVIPSVVEESPK